MDYEQKLQALEALVGGDIALHMRKPGDWYVMQSYVKYKERPGSSTVSSLYGNGRTPEEAVHDHWRQLTEIKPPGCLAVGEYGRRRYVRWNGFMWQDVT